MFPNCQGAWYLAFEFDDGRTARGDCRTLDVFVDEGAPFHIYFVKYFANHVKGRDQVWSDIPYIQTHGFANVHLHGFVSNIGAHRTVKYNIVWVLIQDFLHIKRCQAWLYDSFLGIKLTPEELTSELLSLIRISYAVFCLI